jgi:hypothetical protein
MKKFFSNFLSLLFGPKEYSWPEIYFALTAISFMLVMLVFILG